jgi:hypothetical protein
MKLSDAELYEAIRTGNSLRDVALAQLREWLTGLEASGFSAHDVISMLESEDLRQ